MGGSKKMPPAKKPALPEKNGKDYARSKRSAAVGWIEPPPVIPPPVKIGFCACGHEGTYTGMTQEVPGRDSYRVAFRCESCKTEFSQAMSWEDARKIRVRGYALQGIELCNHCGDPLLDKDGKPHRHDDVKKSETESA